MTTTDESLGFNAHDLHKSFGRRQVLDGLTLSVPPGRTLGLLGANGSGKTTLLEILLGLLPADRGEATVAGHSSTLLPPAVRARVGYVPQSPKQFGWLNGKNMLSYVAAFHPGFDWSYVEGLVDRWKVSLRTPIDRHL